MTFSTMFLVFPISTHRPNTKMKNAFPNAFFTLFLSLTELSLWDFETVVSSLLCATSLVVYIVIACGISCKWNRFFIAYSEKASAQQRALYHCSRSTMMMTTVWAGSSCIFFFSFFEARKWENTRKKWAENCLLVCWFDKTETRRSHTCWRIYWQFPSLRLELRNNNNE